MNDSIIKITETLPEDRFSRQRDLVPLSKLVDTTVSVFGVGAIGRQLALQLASIGVPSLRLIDFDTVEETNITTQGYKTSQLKMPKVTATASDIAEIDPKIRVEAVNQRFTTEAGMLSPIVFSCVDSITSRKGLWRIAKAKADLFVDARMLGELMRVITVSDDESKEHYPSTLFEEAEAEPGRCTARSTIYTASVAAGLMVSQLTKFLREERIMPDFMFDLRSMDLIQMELESAV